MVQRRKLPKGISRGGRDGKSYIARISVNGTQYYLGLWPTLTDAKTALQIAWGQKAAGTFIPPAERRRLRKAAREKEAAEQLTVAQWFDVWIESLEDGPNPRSPGTITSYRSTVNVHILPMLGERPLTKITNDDVAECVTKAKDSGAGASRNVVRTLRAMFNAAVLAGAGGLTESPVKVKFEKGSSRRRSDSEIPEVEEVNALARAMTPETYLAVVLAFACDLRLGEVLGLQRRDFTNLDKPGKATLVIERQWLSKAKPPAYGAPKDDSYRRVAIPDMFAPEIQAHLTAYVDDAPDAPVFPSPRDKTRPMSHNAFASRWNAARDKERPGTAFHALRHKGLTVYAQTGATGTDTGRRGGHKDPDSAQIYQHSSERADQENTARMNEVLKKIWR